jgi:PAS domain-containing protein
MKRRFAAVVGPKQAEEHAGAVDRGLELRASMIDAVDEALVAVDADGVVVFMNRASEELYGCPAGFALGRPVADALPVRLPEGLVTHLLHRPPDVAPWTGEVAVLSEDPGLVSLTITPIRVDDEVMALLITARGHQGGDRLGREEPSARDEATSLLNRRGAIAELAELVTHHDFAASPVVVIRLELEGLGAVSDAYGEPASSRGDALGSARGRRRRARR